MTKKNNKISAATPKPRTRKPKTPAGPSVKSSGATCAQCNRPLTSHRSGCKFEGKQRKPKVRVIKASWHAPDGSLRTKKAKFWGV